MVALGYYRQIKTNACPQNYPRNLCIENLFPFPIDFEVKNYVYQHDENEVSPLPKPKYVAVVKVHFDNQEP